jgi:hypothetical protein
MRNCLLGAVQRNFSFTKMALSVINNPRRSSNMPLTGVCKGCSYQAEYTPENWEQIEIPAGTVFTCKQCHGLQIDLLPTEEVVEIDDPTNP